MYRKLDKENDLKEKLKELEKIELEQVKKIQKLKDAEFKKNELYNNELDSAFYFSVVFNNRNERDEWLKNHNIILEEDFFVKVENFSV